MDDSRASKRMKPRVAGWRSLARLVLGAGFLASASFAVQLQVSDFGAKGDGLADDGPAIQRAVAAASAAKGPVVLVFEKKTYRIDRLSNAMLMDFTGVRDLTVKGNGALLRNNAHNGSINLRSCTNATVGGFTLESEPLSFSQGTIASVDAEAGTFEVALGAGHLNWDEERRAKRIAGLSFGMFLDAREPRKKLGPNGGDFFRTESTSTPSPGRVKVVVESNHRRQLLDLVPGDRMVQLFYHGGHGHNFGILGSVDCAFEDITVYSAKYGMTFAVVGNETRPTLRRITIKPKPGTDRLLATPRDGMHCKHNRVGPLIENCHFEGLLDDSINVSATPYWVKRVEGEKTCVVSSGPPRVGDRLLAYNPSQEAVPTYRVAAVEAIPEAAKGRTWYRLALVEPIRDFVLQTSDNEFPGGPDKLKVTGLYNLDACGGGFIIRSNTFGPQRRFAVLARTRGTIAGNFMYGCGGSAMNLGNEIGSFYEGPFPSRMLIERNRISDVLGDAIAVYSTSLLREPLAHSIVIRDNDIAANVKGALRLSSASNIEITGNRISISAGVASNLPAVLLENCRDVRIEGNSLTDPRGALPAVVGRETWPVDVKMGKNAWKTAVGTPELGLEEPPPSGLAMPKKVSGISVSIPGKDEIPFEKSPWTQGFSFKGKVVLGMEGHMAYEIHPPFGKGVASSSLFFGGERDLTGVNELRFHAAKRASGGDGVVVRLHLAEGNAGEWREIFQVPVREPVWGEQRVDLSRWSGEQVRWRFEVFSGRETSFDSTLLGDIRWLGR